LITYTGEPDEDDIGVDNPEKTLGAEVDNCSGYDIRFVVKVHSTSYVNEELYHIVLYDRNRELCVRFNSKVIDQLLKEFGVLCREKTEAKKLFFHCLYEDNGQLRLFTNEFAEFQNW
jgi:hypothetical protein